MINLMSWKLIPEQKNSFKRIWYFQSLFCFMNLVSLTWLHVILLSFFWLCVWEAKKTTTKKYRRVKSLFLSVLNTKFALGTRTPHWAPRKLWTLRALYKAMEKHQFVQDIKPEKSCRGLKKRNLIKVKWTNYVKWI